jgi:hypothetical protein
VKALVVGHSEPAGALTSALSEQGVEAELHAVPRAPEGRAVGELAAALVDLEGRLAARSSDVAIAVGTGDAPVALALVAAKLSVPLVAWVERDEGVAGPLELAERRILGELANLDAGPVGDGPAAFEAARRIAGWLAGRSGTDPART